MATCFHALWCEQSANLFLEGWLKLLPTSYFHAIERRLNDAATQHLSAPGVVSLGELMRLYVMRPGKRVRPQLVAWTYLSATQSNDDAPLTQSVLDVAAAWEIFHAFLLIHDDIIDGSDFRRLEPALHRQLQSLDSDSPRFGANLAIVAGDLMYAGTMRLLADLPDVTDSAYRQLHQVFAQVAQLTGFGQAIDILQSHTPIEQCNEQTLLSEYHWKTAAYTFEGPMLCGAILAGADVGTRHAISRFALSIGQAYQLQNDLLDLARPVTEGSDMTEAKRTITLLRARASMRDTHRADFDADLALVQAADGRALAIAESLRKRVIASGALDATRVTLDALLSDAHAATDDRALPPGLAHAMRNLLQSLSNTYFRPANSVSA